MRTGRELDGTGRGRIRYGDVNDADGNGMGTGRERCRSGTGRERGGKGTQRD